MQLDEVDSTNDEARRHALSGGQVPIWIAAKRQVKGRGRQGRPWAEADGNLYATLLIHPDMPTGKASLLSFAACLAVAELFEACGGAATLKWPNDALLNGGKAAGVLLEGSGQGASLDWLAIGIGVNLTHAPSDVPGAIHPPTSIFGATGQMVSADDALTRIAASLHRSISVLREDGFGPIRDAWISRAARMGERITARLPGEDITGIFEDVDAEGALVLRTTTGQRHIHAADIYFP
ncbi:MAG: biotin--[acetyl-CoA-carboxylase] ligase [Pseudomonadota bacterium]